MALEDRVKQLEDELKVLKNEIQTTLLDIQEQVLTNYYPSLYPSRRQDAPPPAPAPTGKTGELPPVPQINITAAPAKPQARYRTNTVTLVEDDLEENPEELEQPEAPPFQAAAPPPEPPPPVAATKPLAPPVDQASTNGKAPPKPEPPTKAEQFQSVHTVNPDVHDEDIDLAPFQELLSTDSFEEELDDSPITAQLLDDMFMESLPFLALDEAVSGDYGYAANGAGNPPVQVTVKRLLQWIDTTVAVLGKRRTNQAITMYVKAGDLSPDMMAALQRLVDSGPDVEIDNPATIRQVIDALGKLNDLIDRYSPEYLNEVLTFIVEVNFG